MKFVWIVCSLLIVAVAQEPSISCNYRWDGETYGCDLIINNPNGFNNFTEIGGIHLEGRTNFDVTFLNRISGVSATVPSIICNTFPNIIRIVLYNTGLSEIGDDAFSGCSRITQLILFVNKIKSISVNAFANLADMEYISLEGNSLSTLPENVFASQRSLTTLNMNINSFETIPVNLFRPLENLQYLHLGATNISSINNQWFINNERLQYLYLGNNRIVLSSDSFVGLNNLATLNLAYNAINEIPVSAFTPLKNLKSLYLNGNNFTALQTDSFSDLSNLVELDISENPIRELRDGSFRGLGNLTSLYMASCGLRQMHSNSFENLRTLTYIYLSFNEIEELPHGVFAPTPNLNYIGLYNNRLKTLHRNRFASLTSLQTLDLDSNVLNALDRAIIDDAVNLDTLYFNGNLCADNYFGNFLISRAQYLPLLEACFSNMRYIVDTVTEGGDEFAFFEGPHPGIVLRVNSYKEVQIALTPFSFLWNPTVEILIGTINNTRSTIRINQKTDVVTVPTPNIIRPDQWNDFRITWTNQVVLVFSGNNNFPFMGYTMQDFFPVNYYGLRAVDTRAFWTVQPFQ